jgi:hypothetical protein
VSANCTCPIVMSAYAPSLIAKDCPDHGVLYDEPSQVAARKWDRDNARRNAEQRGLVVLDPGSDADAERLAQQYADFEGRQREPEDVVVAGWVLRRMARLAEQEGRSDG